MAPLKALLVVLMLALGCCPQPKHPSVDSMAESTVRLVDIGRGGELHTYCGATWIGPETILTAAHCVAPECVVDLEAGTITCEEPDLHFAMRDGVMHDANLVKRDEFLDLALLKSKAHWDHLVAKLGLAPKVADRVFSMNHSKGLDYSYMEGVISAIRVEDGLREIQVDGSMTFGASGSCLWDMDGNCIGVTSTKVRNESIVFYIHRDHIYEFLK